jgi:hypothetical protein
LQELLPGNHRRNGLQAESLMEQHGELSRVAGATAEGNPLHPSVGAEKIGERPGNVVNLRAAHQRHADAE